MQLRLLGGKLLNFIPALAYIRLECDASAKCKKDFTGSFGKQINGSARKPLALPYFILNKGNFKLNPEYLMLLGCTYTEKAKLKLGKGWFC